MSKLTCIEFCAGCGGMAKGFDMTGYYKHVLLIDNYKQACETLRINFDKNIVLEQDINTINFSQKKFKNLDIALIGSPCQSFSYAGKKRGLDDPRGKILLKFIEFLEICKPKSFLIENVAGLKSYNKGETLNNIIKDIANLGYFVKYEILNAAYYDVPQKRKRLFIFGNLFSDSFKFPTKNEKMLTLKHTFDDINDNKITAKYSENKLKYFKKIPQGGCWIDLPIEDQKKYLGASFNSGGGKRGILRRLSFAEPSLTLLCSVQQKQTERCHPTEDRPLTIKEYARIQTFPDDYKISGAITHQYKQIGNAVPVNLAKKIAKTIYVFLKDFISDRNNESDELDGKIKDNLNKMSEFFNELKTCYNNNTKNAHIIDTTKMIFDMKYKKISKEEWYNFEIFRQMDKAINNRIGYFHQIFLGNVDGWINLDYDKELRNKYKVDLCNSTFDIFIEIKNKYNTLNSSSRESTYNKLLSIKKNNPKCRIILAYIISKPSMCGYKSLDNGIEILSGDKLYELILGDKDGFIKTQNILHEFNV